MEKPVPAARGVYEKNNSLKTMPDRNNLVPMDIEQATLKPALRGGNPDIIYFNSPPRFVTDDELLRNYLKALHKGVPNGTAAALMGMSPEATNVFAAKGRRLREYRDRCSSDGYEETEEDKVYKSKLSVRDDVGLLFLQYQEWAIAHAEVAHVENWTAAALTGDWRASMEFLARRFPDRWSAQGIERRIKIDINQTTRDETIADPHQGLQSIEYVVKMAQALADAGVITVEMLAPQQNNQLPSPKPASPGPETSSTLPVKNGGEQQRPAPPDYVDGEYVER